MKYICLFFLTAVAALPGISVAQSPLEADAVGFRLDSAHAQVEIEYGVLEHALSFNFKLIRKDSIWTAPIAATVEVWQNGAVAAKKEILDTVRCPCTQKQLDSAGANKLLGSASFAVPYVEHTVCVFIWRRGVHDGKPIFDTIAIPITLPNRDTTKFALSGIELSASVVKATDVPTTFDKAGFVVTPNPSAIYGDNYTKLYFYSELYVPRSLVDPSQTVEVSTEIVDPSNKTILSSSSREPLKGETLAIIRGIDIDGLPEDSYKLRVKVRSEDAIVAEEQKTFFFASEIKLSEEPPAKPSGILDDSVLYAGSDFAKLGDAEATDRLSQSMYWADESDKKTAKKLTTTESKSRFLFGFWRAEDAKLHSEQPLDAYRLFMKRVSESNKQFTHQKTPGWKTDCGRIMITYGPPKQIQNVSFDPSYQPHIIWTYDPDQRFHLRVNGSPEFDFLDKQGGGNYYLVNSNVIGENYEPDWMTREALRLAH
jgi:GWxTD domain-containing protein